MKHHSFSLNPFPSSFPIHGVEITGTLSRRGGVLSVSYELLGLSTAIALPASAAVPSRKDGLWNETCFELFLATRDSDQYWEFNFSPAGHWNVFRFESYRESMREEPAFASLPFSVRIHDDALSLFCEVNLKKIIRRDQAVKAGISAVVRSAEGKYTYWALTHTGTQPDFHGKDCFLIEC